MPKALVTGATGFIGSHIADLLFERGYEVRCIIRKSSNLRWLAGKPYELIEASLNEPASLEKAAEGVDFIFHSAGLTAAKNYDEFLRGNRDGTRNLLEAASKASPDLQRFLFVSSQTAAGPSESLEHPIDEEAPCRPITSYGKSKKAAEDEVEKFSDSFPVTIVRPSAVYGPRDTAIFDVFKAVNAGLGTLIGFKPKYVNLVHSEDLARGIVDAAESGNTIGKTYFVSSNEFYNWHQLMDVMKDAFGKKKLLKIKLPHSLVLGLAALSGLLGKLSSKPPVFNYEKGIDFIQEYWTCSTGRAKADFGYQQKMSIESGMKNTVGWYRDNNWL